MQSIKVRPLPARQIIQCFPLVNLAVPDLTRTRWQSFASSHLGRSPRRTAGILAAEQANGCILGLLIYQIEPDPRHHRALIVKSIFAQAHFARIRRQVVRDLLDAAEDLARSSSCRALHILMPLPDWPAAGDVAETLEARGHVKAGITFSKPLLLH